MPSFIFASLFFFIVLVFVQIIFGRVTVTVTVTILGDYRRKVHRKRPKSATLLEHNNASAYTASKVEGRGFSEKEVVVQLISH